LSPGFASEAIEWTFAEGLKLGDLEGPERFAVPGLPVEALDI
jgi:hypothetical protein